MADSLGALRAAAFFTMLLLAFTCSSARAEHWALLVAAPRCADASWPELKFAEQDIARLAELLDRCGYAKERIVRLSAKAAQRDARLAPTRENLLKNCRGLASRAAKGDTLLIVLSGHGGERQAGEHFEPCFFPADGSPNDFATLAPLSQIVATIEGSDSAARIVLVVDACRTRPKNHVASDERETDFPPAPLPAHWSVFWSCSSGQSAYEDPRVQHGVFAHYLIEALRGSADASEDGRVTFAELVEFVAKRSENHVRQRLEKEQKPEVIGPSDPAESVEIVTLPSDL